MRSFQSFLASLPLVAVATNASPLRAPREQPGAIQWSPCELPGATVPLIECGTLDVPLDYSVNRPNETLTLSLQRVPASKSPKLGSILLNFGGPGFDGTGDLAFFAQRMQAVTGGYHDLINVVPRGTGTTLPFSCYPDATTRALTQTLLAGNASDASLGQIWAEASILADTCYAAQNETGSLIGTAFVARDLMQIVDALDEDGLLRYWGVSYGTILGATVAAMFPERMDKVIVDGVVNPFEYYSNTEVELFTSMDDSFSGFCEGCISHPDACPLAGNLTAAELEDKIYAFIDAIKFEPLVFQGTLITYSLVKPFIARQLYFPHLWPGLASTLHGVMTGDVSVLANFAAPTTTTEEAEEPVPNFDEALLGIKCSDMLSYTDDLDDKRDVFKGRLEISRIGGDSADMMVARCSQWRMPAKERYDGDFDIRTETPMLIIGNTYDPVTPLASARNLSETIETSVLLQQDSYGHDSLIVGSLCTAKAIRSYFVKGRLPEEGTICDTEVELFSGTDGWDEIIAELEANPLKC